MTNVTLLLNERLKKKETSSKMAAMARQTADGNLTSFSGIFSVTELSEHEKDKLESLLKEYALEEDINSDLTQLISLTSEVKAINNQAALLHGERIKKAHDILIRYREGAFSAWLIAAYGNRQTPYNLMQYYEFCMAMPKSLRFQIEAMPRQAVYTLASREGTLEKKKQIVENYNGESKIELLSIIREVFPLDGNDRRKQNHAERIMKSLIRVRDDIKKHMKRTSASQKEDFFAILDDIKQVISSK